MENFVWRPRAKVVAIVDIVIICLSTLLALFFVVMFSSVLLQTESTSSYAGLVDNSNGVGETQESVPSGLYWIFAVIGLICLLVIGLQLWAAVKLLRAGTIGEEPKNALRMAQFWRNVTIVLMILTIAGQLRRLNIIGLLFTILWRGISLYVVHNFIEEVETHLKSPRYPVNNQPEDVIVKK